MQLILRSNPRFRIPPVGGHLVTVPSTSTFLTSNKRTPFLSGHFCCSRGCSPTGGSTRLNWKTLYARLFWKRNLWIADPEMQSGGRAYTWCVIQVYLGTVMIRFSALFIIRAPFQISATPPPPSNTFLLINSNKRLYSDNSWLVVLARKDPGTTSPFSSLLDPLTFGCFSVPCLEHVPFLEVPKVNDHPGH